MQAVADAPEGARLGAGRVLRSASVSAFEADPAAALMRVLGPGPFALVLIFAAPRAPMAALAAAAAAWPGARAVIGCTTAGEITGAGYAEDEIVGIGQPAELVEAEVMAIPDLDRVGAPEMLRQLAETRARVEGRRPNWTSEFAMLLVDGLSRREDALAAALSAGIGRVPLFGGSAGDGEDFGETRVLIDGAWHRGAAVLAFVRTACRAAVFNLDHFDPTEERMIVTQADPEARLVRRLNGEPAAREYARVLGLDRSQLSAFTFAAHPLVVRIGGRHHVRAIQRVTEAGELVFYAAIDEGMVLSLAEPRDIAQHLDASFEAMAREDGPPDAILAFDCILRRLEATEKQMGGRMSAVLRKHGIVGFSTYGEQLNGLHVNQTMTGVALRRP
ncbi:FIST N-terminal domain-containing protein [Limimaricola soesokkakensis]|uniref:FIST N-terminal domain-containing protein n=1 Tax=Limimaricola soesokkakensis TaxID=1343159 RepID=UPI003511213C